MRTFVAGVSIVISLFLFGCASSPYVDTSTKMLADNGAITTLNHLENLQTKSRELSFPDQYNLCVSYGDIKDYMKLFRCVDSYYSHSEHKHVEKINKYRISSLNSSDVQRIATVMRNNMQMYVLVAIANASLEKYDIALLEIEKARNEVKELFDWFRQLSRRTGESPELINNLYVQSVSAVLASEAIIYVKKGENDKARKIFLELDELYGTIDTNIPKYDSRYVVNFSLGLIAWTLEDYQKCYEIFHLNRSLPKQDVAKGIGMQMGADEMYAASLVKLGRFKEADTAFTHFFNKYDGKVLSEKPFYYRGKARAGLNDHKQAVLSYKKGIEILEQQRSTLNSEGNKIGFIGTYENRYADIVKSLLLLGKLDEAFEYVERGKSRTLVDILAEIKSFGSSKEQKQSSIILQNLKDEELKLSSKTKVRTSGRNVYLRSVAEQKELIRQATPELASLVTVSPVTAKNIQLQLKTDETLLEYYGEKESLVVFIVSRDSVNAVTLDNSRLIEQVDVFRKDILSYNSKSYLAEAQALYRKILRQVIPFVKTKNIIVVAHGALHYLPFNALHDGESFLIDKYSIRMLPSASVLEFLGKNSNTDDSMLVLANPDLGNTQYDLPAADEEGQAIAKGKNGVKVLSRKAATETALRKYGSSTSRLHIASHGQFKAEEPLKSRILLARDSENDGNLTVDELYTLDLNNDLVVLSACETGLGDVKNGDDVIGLTRGFLFAGADSIVSSLWVVDDTATANLMVAFYDGLETTSKQEALRQAQLKIKNEYNEHPFFWAAFQLTGSM